MNRKPIAWITSNGESLSPCSEYLDEYLLPSLGQCCDVVRMNADDLLDSSELQEKIKDYTPFYNIEAGRNWSNLLNLSKRNPGVIYLHDLHHLDSQAHLRSIEKDVVEKNIILISNPRHLTEFDQMYPKANSSFAPFPASASKKHSTASEISICTVASIDSEENVHRLFRALQELETPYDFHWLIDEAELDQAEALAMQHGVAVNLHLGRSVGLWRRICEKSDYSVFLTSSVIRSTEPFVITSIASGCSTVLSSRIHKDSYPTAVHIPVSLGVTLEKELSLLFSQYPQGCIEKSAVETFLKEQRNVDYLCQEIVCSNK